MKLPGQRWQRSIQREDPAAGRGILQETIQKDTEDGKPQTGNMPSLIH